MANTGEPLINVVTENKPKVLGCFTETAEPRKGSQAWAKRARPWVLRPQDEGYGTVPEDQGPTHSPTSPRTPASTLGSRSGRPSPAWERRRAP